MQINTTELLNKLTEQNLYRKNTIIIYISSFKRVILNVFNGKCPKIEDLMNEENVKKVLEYINSKEVKVTVRPTILNGYLKCLLAYGLNSDLLNDELDKIYITSDNLRVHQILTESEKEKEKDREISFEELIKRRDEYKKKIIEGKFTMNDIYYFVLCLYTKYPPQRGQIYFDTLLYEKCSEIDHEKINVKNYVCLECKTMYLFSYKNKIDKKIEKFVFEDDLMNDIKHFHKITGSNYLLCNLIKKAYDQNNFPKLLKRATGGKIGSTGLRNQYVRELKQKNTDIETRKEVAKKMLHTYTTQELLYTKLYTNLDDNEVELLKKEIEELKAKIKRLEKENKLLLTLE